MTRLRALDPARHARMRYDRHAGGAARRFVTLGRSEIALAAADMPLCFAKDAQTGRFDLIALLDLAGTGNLFASPAGYHATYQPNAAALAAFRLDPGGAGGLAVDETEQSVTGTGAALFDGDVPAALLTDVRDALERLVDDVAAARALAERYAALGLLQPLHLSLTMADGGEQVLDGLYIVSDAALAALDDAVVIDMHRADELAPAAVTGASLAQVERLRQLHNARHPVAIATFRLALAD